MSRAEQIRGKLFGGKTNGDKVTDEPPLSRSSSDVPLSIHIPRPPLSTQPTPPKKDTKSDSPAQPEVTRDSRSFRERLVEAVGPDYHGAERYRLVQDDTKQLHWKRWGPYLSDRQWVSNYLFVRQQSLIHAIPSRRPFARTTRIMGTLGRTFPMNMRALVPIDGVKTA